nr:polyprotein 2 [Cassava Congo sequivirus]
MFFLLAAGSCCFLINNFTSKIIRHFSSFQFKQHRLLSLYFYWLQTRAVDLNDTLLPSPPISELPYLEEEMSGSSGTLTLADVGLDHTATPAQMIAALAARKKAQEAKAAEAKSTGLATAVAKWVGGAEEIRLSEDLRPLGRYEVYTHDPLLGRVLAGRFLDTSKTPSILDVEVSAGIHIPFEGYDLNHVPKPSFVDIPLGVYNKIRKHCEASGAKTFDSSALDIHMQSHLGQGSPVKCTVALMDHRWENDWKKALLAGGEFDLGNPKPRLFSLPLINLSANTLLQEDYCPLYLMFQFHGIEGYRKGADVLTVGHISFLESFKVTYSPYTRMRDSFDRILEGRDSSRIVSGLHCVREFEKDYTEALPDTGTIKLCLRPTKACPILIGTGTVPNNPNFSLPRSTSSITSIRRRAKPRNSIDKYYQDVVEKRKDKDLHCESCSDETGFGDMLGEFPSGATSSIVPTPQRSLVPKIQMVVKNQGGEQNMFLREYRLTVGTTNLVEGSLLGAISLKSLLSSDQGSAYQKKLSLRGAGKLTLRFEITLKVPKNSVGVYKAYYDVGLHSKNTSDLHGIYHLPGELLTGVEDQKAILHVSPFCFGDMASFKESTFLGQICIGCLPKPSFGEGGTNLTLRIRCFVESIDTWYESALGNFSFSSENPGLFIPQTLYIGDPVFSFQLDTGSKIDSQWRAPIIPNKGLFRDKVWYPNCSSSLFEAYHGWRGKCHFRWFCSSPLGGDGTFNLYAVPPGAFDVTKVNLDVLNAAEEEGIVIPNFSIDLRSMQHGEFEVDFTSWQGFFPAGKCAQAFSDIQDCPWLILVQTSNLTCLNKVFNKFIFFVELVKISECKLLGPTWVPATRISFADQASNMMAQGDALQIAGNWTYAGQLTQWGERMWWVFPVTPNKLPLEGLRLDKGGISNPAINMVRQRAKESYLWRGALSYKLLFTKNLSIRGSYSSYCPPGLKHGFYNADKTINFQIGSFAHFAVESTTQLSLDIDIPNSELLNYRVCLSSDDASKHQYFYNGWLFVLLPKFETGQRIVVYIKPGLDLEFGGFYPAPSLKTTLDPTPDYVFSD